MQLSLADHGKTLATRPLGAKLRGGVTSQVDDLVVLDFAGVLAVSYSFADEFIGRLAEIALRADGGFEIHMLNASDEVLAVIDRAVELRGVAHALKVADPA
jgi:hypothetical protein